MLLFSQFCTLLSQKTLLKVLFCISFNMFSGLFFDREEHNEHLLEFKHLLFMFWSKCGNFFKFFSHKSSSYDRSSSKLAIYGNSRSRNFDLKSIERFICIIEMFSRNMNQPAAKKMKNYIFLEFLKKCLNFHIFFSLFVKTIGKNSNFVLKLWEYIFEMFR